MISHRDLVGAGNEEAVVGKQFSMIDLLVEALWRREVWPIAQFQKKEPFFLANRSDGKTTHGLE